MRKTGFCLCENKSADRLCSYIGCAVTAQQISAFVFLTQIVQSLFLLHPKFKLLALCCDCTDQFLSDLVGKSEDRFSHVGADFVQANVIEIEIIWRCYILCNRHHRGYCYKYEPRRKKTNLRGFRPCSAQTGLCICSRWLEA